MIDFFLVGQAIVPFLSIRNISIERRRFHDIILLDCEEDKEVPALFILNTHDYSSRFVFVNHHFLLLVSLSGRV